MYPQINGRNSIAYRALEAFFRHNRLFWVATVGITSLVMIALYVRNRSYAASASTQIVTEQEVATVLGLTKTNWATPAQQNVGRFNDLLRDDEPGGFLDSVLKNARLQDPISVDPRVRDQRFNDLRRKLSVQVDSADVFTLSLVWHDAGECERILRALQSGYIEESGSSRQAQSIATANFLDTQIQSYKHRMRVAEKALINYKRNNFGQLPEAQTAEIEQLGLLKSERDYLNISSQDALLQRKALETRLAQIKPTTILEETVRNNPKAESPNMVGLRGMELRRLSLIAEGWRPDSTRVKQLDGQIRALKNRLAHEQNAERVAAAKTNGKTNVVQTTTQSNPEYTNLMEQLTQTKIAQSTDAARLKLLNQHIGEYEKRVQKLPAAARELTDKTRDYSIMKEQYEDLLKRREQAQIKANLDKVAATSTLHPIGVVYASPTSSAKKNTLLLAGTLVFSMMVGAGLVIVAELTDPSLRYTTDVERLLGARAIASLPSISSTPTLSRITGGDYSRIGLGQRERFDKKAAAGLNPQGTSEL